MHPTWKPHAGPQTRFLATTVYEALYGGAAGGGKSEALIMGALRFIAEPSYRALIVRRTYAELQQLIDRAQLWYSANGGTYNKAEHRWSFPSGATIEFGHCETDSDVTRYQGREYSFLGIDEITLLSEKVYLFLLSRLRSTAGLPIYVRCTGNPGGPGHEWVFRRWQAWLDPRPDYHGPRAEPGKPLYYRNTDGGEVFVEKSWRGPNGEKPLSRVFIPAKATDNPALMQNDPGYVDRLGALDPVTRAQLRDGNWLVKPAAGLLFKRAWFKFVPLVAAGQVVARVRRWDLASTEGGGDWTVGVLMARLRDGSYVVEDVVRGQWRPKTVEATVKATAELDGRSVRVVLPQDPGQAGKAQCEHYAKLLAGYIVRFERETGSKEVRAQPFSAQCEAGNVSLVRASWNEPFIQTLEGFPDGDHDDDVDASSGAFNSLIYTPVTYPDDDWEAPKRAF